MRFQPVILLVQTKQVSKEIYYKYEYLLEIEILVLSWLLYLISSQFV